MASVNLRMAILSMILTSVATAFLVWTFYEGRLTTRRELRAYLCLKPVVMEKIVVSPAPHLTITLPIENTGSTPANKWQIQWAWQVTNDAPTAQMFDSLLAKYPLGKEQPDFSFGPKQVKENPIRIEIANDWRAKVISGEMKFYFVGRIHYLDAFDTRRMTDFFYYYTEDLPNRMGQVQFGNKIA